MSVDTLNIIVFDYKETVIKWLDPELADIKETTTEDACRKIEITYPYENEEITEEQTLWYDQGNKIYIPSMNGITSCLYVINTEYSIDFWKDNTITITAEEVLTELNYDVISFENADAIPITVSQLDEWFGSYYTISGVDTLKANHSNVSPEGIMTYMSLFRMIEEQTERKFITTYESEGNKINRYLRLVNIDNDEYIAPTETLDLNYNLDSLEFIKSEENTYNSMAPILNSTNATDVDDIVSSTNIGTTTSNIVSNAQNNTTTTEEERSILQDWIDYEVMEGETVPMIIQKDDEGNTVASAYWSAPFKKEAGQLYISHEGTTRANYTHVHPFDESKAPPRAKCGTVSTSETLMPAIYNVLANALLAKIQPDFELKIDVKDIQMLLGNDNLGYQLYESLQVKVPNFNYFVPCRITETVKNLHLPGENSIRIKTEVASITEILDSQINSHDVIISSYDKDCEVGGILTSNGEPLANQLVTVTVRLHEAYATENNSIQQHILTFDPFNQTYVFSSEQIWNLEKVLRNGIISNDTDWSNAEYRLRDVTGNVYSVPSDWCNFIYFAFLQIHEDNKAHGKDTFDKTITVHYYENAQTLVNSASSYEDTKKYYVSWMYDFLEDHIDLYETLYSFNPGVSHGFNPYVPTTTLPGKYFTLVLYTVLGLLKKYVDFNVVYEIIKDANTPAEGYALCESDNRINLQYDNVRFTWENVKNYVAKKPFILLVLVNTDYLQSVDIIPSVSYSNPDGGWYIINGWATISGTNYVKCINPFSQVYSPSQGSIVTEYVHFNALYNAVKTAYSTDEIGSYYDTSAVTEGDVPGCMVLSLDERSLADYEEVKQMIVNTEDFSPDIKTYKFNINTIRETSIQLMKNMTGTNVYLMSASTSMKSTDNTVYDNVGMNWIRAMCLAYMFYYRTHEEKSSNLTINAGVNEDSGKYMAHIDTGMNSVGNYDWFSPCYPSNSNNRLGYICATLLFNLGIPYSPYDFNSTNSYDSLSDIAEIIANKAGNGNINYVIKDLNSSNLQTYLSNVQRDEFMETVILTYAYSTSLNNTAYFSQTNYPIMLYGRDNTTIRYMNILANGNSPTNRYNVPVSSAGDYNPYGETSISNIVSWNNSVTGQLQGGDKNKMLVLSWKTQSQLGGE